ncbi:MAG: ferrochelatase [Bacteroidota bacterium]|jgi:ferrochelatase
MIGNSKLTFHKKTAIVLFQLGGPDSLEAIEPFLYNLFMDSNIIDFPGAFLVRRPLAKFISSRRSVKVAKNYSQIGGKSPILDLTQRQASALESVLQIQNIEAHIFIAMRYWHPMTDEVVQKIKADGFEQVLLLPLYPQFSQATTLSSMNDWKRQTKKQGCVLPTKFVCCYPSQPLFIEALAENINSALVRFHKIASTDIDLIFSAHGVPLSYIKRGDPYQLQMEETVRCIVERGKWNSPHTLCYQSKVGPMKWLQPSLIETVEDLADKGRKHLLVIPVAFVTDHIETLHEINIDVRRHAMAHGIQQFELMPALNDHPKFIQCLAELVQAQLASDVQPNTCEALWKNRIDRPIPTLCPWSKSQIAKNKS